MKQNTEQLKKIEDLARAYDFVGAFGQEVASDLKLAISLLTTPSHDEIKREAECVTLYGTTEHGYNVEVDFPLGIIKDYLTQSKEGGGR